jgi:hypothetical protein
MAYEGLYVPAKARGVTSQHSRYWGHLPYRLLVGKPEGKRPLGRPRRRCIDNMKMDLLEIELGVVD